MKFNTYAEKYNCYFLDNDGLETGEDGVHLTKESHKKLAEELKEEIDLMIDDDYKIIEKLSNNNIKTLYFRDTGLKKLEENEYIKEVNNWGDIYRYIKSLI